MRQISLKVVIIIKPASVATWLAIIASLLKIAESML